MDYAPTLMEDPSREEDRNPTAYLEDRLARRLGLTDVKVGQTFPLTATAKISSVSANDGEDGIPRYAVTIELVNMTIDKPQSYDGNKLYPSMK
jgi:hypothetical protein